MKTAVLPHIRPIIVKKKRYPIPLDDPERIYEPKLDGFRAIAKYDGRTLFLTSRSEKPLDGFTALRARIVSSLDIHDAVLDGEIVSLDASNRPIFKDLLSRRGNIVYVAFDIMWVNGRDLRLLPLKDRKAILYEVAENADKSGLRLGLWCRGCGDNLFRAVQDLDLEGIVVKGANSPYTTHAEWIKVLNPNYSKAGDHSIIARAKAALRARTMARR